MLKKLIFSIFVMVLFTACGGGGGDGGVMGIEDIDISLPPESANEEIFGVWTLTTGEISHNCSLELVAKPISQEINIKKGSASLCILSQRDEAGNLLKYKRGVIFGTKQESCAVGGNVLVISELEAERFPVSEEEGCSGVPSQRSRLELQGGVLSGVIVGALDFDEEKCSSKFHDCSVSTSIQGERGRHIEGGTVYFVPNDPQSGDVEDEEEAGPVEDEIVEEEEAVEDDQTEEEEPGVIVSPIIQGYFTDDVLQGIRDRMRGIRGGELPEGEDPEPNPEEEEEEAVGCAAEGNCPQAPGGIPIPNHF